MDLSARKQESNAARVFNDNGSEFEKLEPDPAALSLCQLCALQRQSADGFEQGISQRRQLPPLIQINFSPTYKYMKIINT